MDIVTPKKTTIAVLLSTLFIAPSVYAAQVYQNDNGDYLDVYGEVGIGGHFGANYDSGEFYKDQSYIDDPFATLGAKGRNGDILYRLELDYQRENWKYATGDMELSIDKMYLGYEFNQHHYIEAGLTDTAFDDYDKYGDFTFDTTVETGEAGDQGATLKYEGRYNNFKAGVSYSYDAESSSGSSLGDVINGYTGYFGKTFSIVLGLEGRNGSKGESKYGEQRLLGLGMRWAVTDELSLGFNGFIEREDIAQEKHAVDVTDPNNKIHRYNDYQTLDHEGALISARYVLTPKWEIVASSNYEAYEHWDDESPFWDGKDSDWGRSRTWGTLGVNFKPTRSSVLAIEGNVGEASQDVYAYARVYF
ncbi:porin [Photobacterium nomapromontoriensis]|uniref:porin n=1 Tax=Photobacterium nomapromontoriensis TaxID=2910237 RepID=UPI003D0EA0EF